jgi:orotate phosphoribosyltransferase
MRRRLDLLSPDRVRLPAGRALAELRADIVRAAYVEGSFVFAGGERRRYYLDKYLFETRPAILRRLARFLAGLVPAGTERLAAPALGAVALGAALSLELGIPLVIVRPDADRGADRAVEGELYPGERVAIVEDVVSSGGRALRAATLVRAAGGRVARVLAVVDRQEGGSALLAEHAIEYTHLFTAAELGITP